MSFPKLDKLQDKGLFDDHIKVGVISFAEETTRNGQSSYIYDTNRSSPNVSKRGLGGQHASAKSMVFNRNKMMMMNNFSFTALSAKKQRESFDVTNKSGKEIVDYFSSFGREGIELFIKEANTRSYYRKSNVRNGFATEKGSPRIEFSQRSRTNLQRRQERPSGFVDYKTDN
jgi:hypothetical protein